MYSFYGGRPGNPFVIVTTFRSVEDMVNEFKKGPEYTAVHYDEHVMINTVNKNDPDNGKIYRRGYDFNDETTGGAEYIGTIVGPSGRAPMLELTDLQTAISKSSTEKDFEEESSEKRIAEGTYNIANGSLVPGKYVVQETDMQGNPKQDDQGNPIYISKYNDEIKWASCSIRNENNEDCTAYIGFKIPYPVFEISSESVEPYDTAEIELDDNNDHPFYKKWKLKIPKGIKGDSVTKLSVKNANELNGEYTNKQEDINKGYQILTYQTCNYDSKNPVQTEHYLSDYNVIKNVTNENGKVTIFYTHAEPTEINFKSINDITLDPNTGKFELTYNDSSNPLIKTLQWIKDITINEETGEIKASYTNKENPVKIGNLTWIDDIKIENGILKYRYKGETEYRESEESQTNPIKWINNIQVIKEGDEAGTIRFFYNDNSIASSQSIKWPTRIYANGNQIMVDYIDGSNAQLGILRGVNSMNFDPETGELKITYSNSEEISLGRISMLAPPESEPIKLNSEGTLTVQYAGEASEREIGKLQWPTNIRLDENTAKLYIDWNDNKTITDIGTINYILEMGINNEGHLLVKYSNPQQDADITYNGTTGWTDVGSALLSDIQYNGNTVTDLNWTGMGVLRNTGAESQAEKIIKFTIVPTQLLRHTLNNVTINAGTITVVKRGESGAITGFNSADLTQKGANVTKTFAGIDFEIPSGIPSDTNAAPEFVDIIITGLSLTFS